MRIVIQRVTHGRVVVHNATIGEINQGLVVLCGFETTDTAGTLSEMLEKTLRYRIFEDDQGKMNQSSQDVSGGLLLVPQFTLLADTKKGLRPSFSKGAPPVQGQSLFNALKTQAIQRYPKVAFGEFGAEMKVDLCNDGPVAFVMRF